MVSDLKRPLGVGILLGLLAALLVIGMGVLALLQLNRISRTMDTLTNQLAVERGLAKDIVGQVQVVRFHMNSYVSSQRQADIDGFYEAYTELRHLLIRAQEVCSDEERAATLAHIHQTVEAYGDAFDEVVNIIRKRQRTQAEILDIQEHLIKDRLYALRINSTFLGSPESFLAYGNARDALEKMQLATTRYLADGNEADAVRVGIGYREAQTAFSKLGDNLQSAAQAETLGEAQAAARTYYEAVTELREDQVTLRLLLQEMREDMEPSINAKSLDIAADIEGEFEQQNAFSQDAIAQATLVLLATTLFAVVAGAGLGNVIMRRTAERVRAQRALRRSEQRYRTLFEGIPVGLYRTTPDRQFINANPALVNMLAYPDRETLLAIPTSEIYVTQADYDRWQALLDTEGTVHSFELQLRQYQGDVIWAKTNVRAVRDADQHILYYEGSVEDITEQKRAEADLVEAQKQLIRQEKLAVLGQMAGGVGHELRNPLSVIANAIYYLQMTLTEIDQTGREYLQIIADEVNNANKIITDLLDFGRIRASDLGPTQVADVIATVLKQTPPADNVEIKTQIPEALPPAYVDGRQMEQVLANLITNAYQAMSEGGALTISADRTNSHIALTVTDTGCGIPAKNMEKLFEPLFTTKRRGIGLGLTVSKMLVEANHGTIQATSEENVGTTFTLTLPLRGQTQ